MSRPFNVKVNGCAIKGVTWLKITWFTGKGDVHSQKCIDVREYDIPILREALNELEWQYAEANRELNEYTGMCREFRTCGLVKPHFKAL